MTAFTNRVYRMVRRIPSGRVVSYGAIAAMIGQPRAARGVGQALRMLPDGSDVPWWRVINSSGRISSRPSIHAVQLQKAMLRGEGVVIGRDGRISWKSFGWDRPSRPRSTL